MKTTLDLPNEKIKRLMRLTGAATKTDAIVWAVEEAIRAKLRMRLVTLPGKIKIADGYNVVKLREREVKERRKQLGLA